GLEELAVGECIWGWLPEQFAVLLVPYLPGGDAPVPAGRLSCEFCELPRIGGCAFFAGAIMRSRPRRGVRDDREQSQAPVARRGRHTIEAFPVKRCRRLRLDLGPGQVRPNPSRTQ